MNSQHELGPWEAFGTAVWYSHNSGDRFIADCDTKENARLMAEVPELLHWLTECVCSLDELVTNDVVSVARLAGTETIGNLLVQSRATIARARGENE